jgi:DNA-binding transcriptional MerR regulator
MTIREVCERTGLSARTVRYYEEQGLLPDVRRKAAGRRVYGKDELERLSFIQRLKQMGLKLAQIRDLNAVYAIAGSTGQMLGSLDELLSQREAEIADRIDELAGLRGEIDTYRQRIRQRIVDLDDKRKSA